MILPILNYSSQVWGFIQGDAIEKVQLQFYKRILGIKRTTENDFVYGELGRVSLQTVRYFNIIKYWVQLLHTDSNKFNKKVYEMLKSDSDENPEKTNWCSLLKSLLCRLGFYDVWLFQTVGNSDIFLYNVKLRLNDNFIQSWNTRIHQVFFLQTYIPTLF